MKIINFFKKNTNSIIIGLITGIILLAIKPLLLYLTSILINFLTLISQKFSDYYYTSMAQNYVDRNAYYSYLIIFATMLAIILLAISKINELKRDLIENKKTEEKNNNIKIDKIKITKYTIILKIFTAIFAIYTFFIYMFNNNLDGLNKAFQNNVIIITPFTDEKQIAELKYEWLTMKNKEDFLSIDNKIEKIYKENNIPENQHFKFE